MQKIENDDNFVKIFFANETNTPKNWDEKSTKLAIDRLNTLGN